MERKSKKEGIFIYVDFPGGSVVKNPLVRGGDRRHKFNSCLENQVGRGAWRATVHWIAKPILIEHMHTHTHTHTYIYVYVWLIHFAVQ